MKCEILALADSVNVYEGGKMVISGTFDKILSPTAPFAFRPFGIAIKIAAEKKDFGNNYDGRIAIRKKDYSKKILELPVNIQFKKPSKSDALVNAILAYNILSINFESFGLHVVELHVKDASGGNKLLASIEFAVDKREAPIKPEKPTHKKRK